MSTAANRALAAASEHFHAGGPVMIPLALVSLILGLLMAHKLLWLVRMSRGDAGREAAARWVDQGFVDAGARPFGAVTLLVTRFLARRKHEPEADRGLLKEIEKALSTRVDDHLAAIGTLAAAAPLLGLLGTVLGMTAAFDVLSCFGTGNARAMANSLSEALITTETGLIIAIPGLYMKGVLDRRAEGIKARLSRIIMHLCVHSLRAGGGEAA